LLNVNKKAIEETLKLCCVIFNIFLYYYLSFELIWQ